MEAQEHGGGPTLTGITCLAFSFFLRERFGEEACNDAAMRRLLGAAGVPPEAVYLPGNNVSAGLGALYSEDAYMKLGQTLLATYGGFTLQELLFDFGRYFMKWLSVRAGYAASMRRVAGTLVEFTRSLNRLLEQMFTTLGNTNSTLPQIHVTDVTQHSFVVRMVGTASPRSAPYLQGILDYIANEVFGISIDFETLQDQETMPGCTCNALIRITSTSPVSSATATPKHEPNAGQPILGLGPETFYSLFPFHLVLDIELRVLQAGSLLQDILPMLQKRGVRIDEVLTIQSPHVPWTMQSVLLLLQNEKQKLVLQGPGNIKLQGGLYKVPSMRRAPDGRLVEGDDVLVMLLSLHMAELLENTHTLHLSDFPAHDLTPDLVLHEAMVVMDLEEERQNNCALKDALAETLAAQEKNVTSAATFNPDSAAHLTIKLLDSLMMGDDVDIQDVLHARDALLKAGTNVWKPLDLDATAIDQDEEVSRSLGELLGAASSKGQVSTGRGVFEASRQRSFNYCPPSKQPSLTPLPSLVDSQMGSRRQDRPTVENMIAMLKRPSLAISTNGSSIAQGVSAADTAPSTSSTAFQGSGLPYVKLSRGTSLDLGDDVLSPTIHRKRSGSSVSLHQVAEQADGISRGRRSSVTVYEPIMRLDGPRSSTSLPTLPATQPSQSSLPNILSPTSSTSTVGSGRLLAQASAPATPPLDNSSDVRAVVCAQSGAASHNCKAIREQDDCTSGSRRNSQLTASHDSALALRQPYGQLLQPVKVSSLLMPSLMPKSRGGTANTPSSHTKPGTEPVDGERVDKKNGLFVAATGRRSSELPFSSPQPFRGDKGANPAEIRRCSYNDEVTLLLTMQPSDQLATVLSSVDCWQFNSFELLKACNGRPLSCLAFHLMKRMDLTSQLQLDEVRLARFLMRIEDGYQSNPYHSRTHAADVLRTFHMVLTRGGVLDRVLAANGASAQASSQTPTIMEEGATPTAVRLLSCYLAAICHDFDHRGVTNDFLIRCSDPLALLYNDISPHENHHVSATFVLMRETQFAFFPTASKQMQNAVRKEVIDLVLATDMKQHFALLGVFNSKLIQSHEHALAAQQQKPHDSPVRGTAAQSAEALEHASLSRAHGEGVLAKAASVRAAPPRELSRSTSSVVRRSRGSGGGGSIPACSPSPRRSDAPTPPATWDHETQMLALKMALKCADLGHLASSKEVHKNWVSRLEEELFRQGDQEKALSQPISPLMDRSKAGVTKSQCGFFNVVALPLFKSLAQVFPGCNDLHENVENNGLYWKEVEAKHAAVP